MGAIYSNTINFQVKFMGGRELLQELTDTNNAATKTCFFIITPIADMVNFKSLIFLYWISHQMDLEYV
jgi:hypothetical protein